MINSAFPNFKVTKVPLGIGDKDLARGLMASKYITIKNKGLFMEDKNKIITNMEVLSIGSEKK